MIPLIDRDFYARLEALRPDLERAGVHPANIAHVFVQVGPDSDTAPGQLSVAINRSEIGCDRN